MYVYFIQSTEGGPIKIGKSDHPSRRLAGLQNGHPQELVIRAVALGGHAAETLLHQHFERSRLRGEWFMPTKELMAIVDKLPSWSDVKAGAFCPEIVNPVVLALRDCYLQGYTLEDCAELTPYSRQRVHQLLRGYMSGGRYSLGVNHHKDDITNKERPARPTTPIIDAYEKALDHHAAVEILLPVEA
jgi:hypothetical protein